MTRATEGKFRTYLPVLLIAAGVILLVMALVDFLQGDGLNAIALAAGTAVIAAGVAWRRKGLAAP